MIPAVSFKVRSHVEHHGKIIDSQVPAGKGYVSSQQGDSYPKDPCMVYLPTFG